MICPGLVLGNTGKTSAHTVSLIVKLEADPYSKLIFQDMPIERIDSGKSESLKVRIERMNENQEWESVVGTEGLRLDTYFYKSKAAETVTHLDVLITINFFDDRGKRHEVDWVIRRTGFFLSNIRIWCEPLHAAS